MRSRGGGWRGGGWRGDERYAATVGEEADWSAARARGARGFGFGFALAFSSLRSLAFSSRRARASLARCSLIDGGGLVASRTA